MSIIMELVATGLLSAIIGGIATFYAIMKFSFISTIKDDNERLRQRVNELEDRINASENREKDALERESFLKNKLTLLETAHHDLPFPQWLKDMSGVMLSVNSSYEKMFLQPLGKTSKDYIGHTDFDIWPTEVAEAFAENDNRAKGKEGYWMGIEPIWIKSSDISPYWRVVKYGRFVGNVCVGVAGIAIPVMEEDIIDKPNKAFIEFLIKDNKIKKALDILSKKINDNDVKQDLNLIYSRYSRWKNSRGKEDATRRSIEKNNIVDALLELIQDL